MADPIADLYVCWRCGNHDLVVQLAAEPPEYHTCGYGPLQWSGQLFDVTRWSRTYDEMPPKVIQHPAPGHQRQADPAAPLCGRCGVNKVNRRRNGSWFPTCYDCGG